MVFSLRFKLKQVLIKIWIFQILWILSVQLRACHLHQLICYLFEITVGLSGAKYFKPSVMIQTNSWCLYDFAFQNYLMNHITGKILNLFCFLFLLSQWLSCYNRFTGSYLAFFCFSEEKISSYLCLEIKLCALKPFYIPILIMLWSW